MKTINWGSRTIKIYFDDKKVDEYEKTKRGKADGYCHGYCDRQEDKIWIRDNMPLVLKRICFWHELSHLCFDFLNSLGNESLAEINGRFIDEILDRNKWIREMYE